MDARARILFVDDEIRVLNSLRATFRHDYEISVADSPSKALDLLQQNQFDVVVSDERMPGMRGHQLLRQVRERSPATVRVLLTGYVDADALANSINEAGVYRYLQKPWSISDLSQVLQDACDISQAAEPILVDQIQADVMAKREGRADNPPNQLDLSIMGVGDHVRLGQYLPGAHFALSERSMARAVPVVMRRPDIGVMVIDLEEAGVSLSQCLAMLHEKRSDIVVIGVGALKNHHQALSLVNSNDLQKLVTSMLSREQSEALLKEVGQQHHRLRRQRENPELAGGVRGLFRRWLRLH
ncbi:MAG: response regulator [Wenzhouxiangellaceae bacterium]